MKSVIDNQVPGQLPPKPGSESAGIEDDSRQDWTYEDEGMRTAFGSWAEESSERLDDQDDPDDLGNLEQENLSEIGTRTCGQPEVVKAVTDVEALVIAGLPSAGRGRVKVDLLTPLEQFFAVSLFLGGFLLFVSLLITGMTFSLVLFSGLSLLALGGVGYRFTDNYYVVDLSCQALVYHFQFLNVTQETVIADFSAISSLTSHSRLQRHKDRLWWDYATALVLNDGTIFPVTDYTRDDLLRANQRARLMAGLMERPFIAGRESADVSVVRDDETGEVQVFHQPLKIEATKTPIIPVLSEGPKTFEPILLRALRSLPAMAVGCLFVFFVLPWLLIFPIMMLATLVSFF